MFKDLNVLQMAHAMAAHAGKRQAVVARNIANSDTPGYKAKDIIPFKQAFADEDLNSGLQFSRAGHIGAAVDQGKWAEFTVPGPADPNNNTVSIEEEMLKAVETTRQHDRALSIYKTSLSILRTSLGRSS